MINLDAEFAKWFESQGLPESDREKTKKIWNACRVACGIYCNELASERLSDLKVGIYMAMTYSKIFMEISRDIRGDSAFGK